MKANLTKKPLLSISMIVKNEEKKLRRCLDSVKKLMEQIDCELIITDTGSTDSTVEIAKEYATIVNHFDWCDDYSAARNYGLKLATGEWYAFIDADEWYSDELIASLVKFLKGADSKKYYTCNMQMRNYSDAELTDFTVFFATRFFKLLPSTHFQNKIHENITIVIPTFTLDGVCHHDGYAFVTSSDAFLDKYNKYNKAIEQQLAQDENNLSVLVSYMSSIKDPVREEEILLKALSLLQPSYLIEFCNSVYYRAIFYYFDHQKYDIAMKYIDEYQSVMAQHNYEIFIDGYQVMALVYAFAKMYPQAIQYADIYLQQYNDYLISPPKVNSITVSSVSKLSKETFLLDIINKIIAYDMQAALKYYSQYDLDDGKFYLQVFDVMLLKYTDTHDRSLLFTLLDSIGILNNVNRRQPLLQKMTAYFLQHIEEDTVFAQLNEYPQNIYTTAFCRLNIALATNTVPQAPANTAPMYNSECITPYLAELMCCGQDISFVVQQLSREQISDATQMLTCLGDRLLRRICLNSITNAQNATLLKPLMLYIPILDASFKCFAHSENEHQQLIATTVVTCMARFARGYYSQELINSNIELLPSAHRFALLADNAINAFSDSDYISFLRNAITQSPDMQPLAQALLAVFERKLNGGELKSKTEFEFLAEKIKQNAKEYIAAGFSQNALEVLSSLKALVPNDIEIDNLIKMCQ